MYILTYLAEFVNCFDPFYVYFIISWGCVRSVSFVTQLCHTKGTIYKPKWRHKSEDHTATYSPP